MTAGREDKIVNTFLLLCLATGFACFSLILLPNQIGKAKMSSLKKNFAKVPQSLASIISLDEPRKEPSPLPSDGPIARFEPAPPPPEPAYAAAGPIDEESDTADAADPEVDVAGGPGAAIDDASAEATLAMRSEPAPAPVIQEAAPSQDGEPLQTRGSLKDSYSLTLMIHKPSSIAINVPSRLDTIRSSAKGDTWLLIPEGLEADVAFWRDIYTKHDRNQVVLHHPQYLGIVYEVVDLTDIENDPRLTDIEKEHLREKRVDERREAVAETLRKLAANPKAVNLTDEELDIKRLFRGTDEYDAYKKAADEYGVRAQLGQRDKFVAGLKYSGRYLGEIEDIYKQYGLPMELTRLIFVESMFNTRAKSSAGASGIWQFMPGTGRLFLKMNSVVDERNDPIAATHASARLLRQNYDVLGSWPLAINAYNTGRGRMSQAAARLGTNDIARIIRGFHHSAYGFASRNFFLEYLAAMEIVEHAERYFGPISYDLPLRYEEVRSTYHISLPDVARVAGVPIESVEELNPGFTAGVMSGRTLVPQGMAIRLPEGSGEMFLMAAARAPRSRAGSIRHVVQGGETLGSIAEMYGVSADDIRRANRGIHRDPHRGQTIEIPFK